MGTVYIYGLVDPRDQQIRYVGATKNPKERFYAHWNDKKHSYKTNWIKSLKKQGIRFDTFIIEETNESAWEESERFWIAYFRYIGANLTNMTDGGEKPCITREQRENLSAKLRIKFGNNILDTTKHLC